MMCSTLVKAMTSSMVGWVKMPYTVVEAAIV